MIRFVNLEAGTTVREEWRASLEKKAAAEIFRGSECAIVHGTPASKREFFDEYVLRSRPTLFKEAARDWPAMAKWSQSYLRGVLSASPVGVKIAPGGVFEGVEPLSLWPDTSRPPQRVLDRLVVTDLVTVRPHHWSTTFEVFLDRMLNSGEATASFYLEYFELRLLQAIARDAPRFLFDSPLLHERTNLWIGDGLTQGKLHFDPHENLLSVVDGAKEFILFPPCSKGMYEGHIRQATLTYDFERDQFSRETLEEATSMVMSPVDLDDPSPSRFPLFNPEEAIRVTVERGDVLFLPAWWWHEVHSSPHQGWNVAVNFWFHPVWTKPFPSPDATLRLDWKRYGSRIRWTEDAESMRPNPERTRPGY